MWLRTYMFCLSVRLGVLIACILSLIYSLILSVLLFARGLNIFEPLLKILLDDDEGKRLENSLISKYTEIRNKYEGNVLLVYQMFIYAHILANLLAIYGLYYLNKYCLLPMMVFDLLRIIFYLCLYIGLTYLYQKVHDLGVLITTNLLAYFVTLFMAYNWAACVALYQLFILVGTERYQSLYGIDPFHALLGNIADNRKLMHVWTTTQKQKNLYKKWQLKKPVGTITLQRTKNSTARDLF